MATANTNNDICLCFLSVSLDQCFVYFSYFNIGLIWLEDCGRVSSIAVGVNRLAYYVQIGGWHDDYEFLEFSLWNQSANLTALLVYNEINHIS